MLQERQNVDWAALGLGSSEVAHRRAKQRSFPRSGHSIHPSRFLAMTKLQYRGASYSNDNREQTSNQVVDHSYRGQHYSAPLRHEAAPVDTQVELQYRGHVYQHRQAEAANQVENA
jgi:hypothetical protein